MFEAGLSLLFCRSSLRVTTFELSILDVIAKYTRMENDFALGTMAGGVNNNALSVSAEAG